jgi:type I restriction enzyme, S subunit
VSDWRECELGDVATFRTGKLNSNAETSTGIYPFFTCSPETLKIDNYAFDEETLLLAGNNANGVFSLKYYKGKFNAYQRTYLISIKEISHQDYKFLFYSLKLQLSNLEHVSHGTATKFLTLSILNKIPYFHPPLPEQKAIATVLSSLDDKIDLLHRQNQTLEAMAETLFRQWFVVEAKEDWEEGKIQDLFILQRGYDLPIQNRIEGYYPIFAASGFSGGHSEYKAKAPCVTTGRSGLLGKVFFVQEDFWPLNTSLYVKEFKRATPLFSYFVLRNIDLESFNAGSAVPTLNRNHLHEYSISIPPDELIKEFELRMMPNFKKIKSNQAQIRTLETIRDTLLPKMMSGEVRVRFDEETA